MTDLTEDVNYQPIAFLAHCGIYCILCKPTKREYIGSSVHIGHRITEHQNQLQRGQHSIDQMQADYDLHGDEAFQVCLIVVCAEEQLLERERAFIQIKLENGRELYNSSARALLATYRSVHSEEKDKIWAMYREHKSWRAVARLMDLSASTVHKFATTDWDPKRKELRVKLGLEEKVDYIRQVRSSDGTFHRKEMP